jgi:hypothetical protein
MYTYLLPVLFLLIVLTVFCIFRESFDLNSDNTLNATTIDATGAVTVGGALNANGGLIVPTGKAISAGGTISAGGLLSANAGMNLPAGSLLTASGGETVNGTETVNGPSIVNGKLTVNPGNGTNVAINIKGNNLLTFGEDPKPGNLPGTISYKNWDGDALSILGANVGDKQDGVRRVHIWDDLLVDRRLFINTRGFGTAVPAIDLAIGDNDTGFHWESDGIFQYFSNSQKKGRFHWDGIEIYGYVNCVTLTITSDKRIKKNITDLSSEESLVLMRKMKPVKYQFKDSDKEVVGFIAQDIQDILPSSVSTQSKLIHNIYEVCTCDKNRLTFSTFKTSELSYKEKLYPLKIKANVEEKEKEQDKETVTILEIIDEHTVLIDKEFEGQIFVYGQEVDDFLSIDQNQLFTVTTSALQELDSQLQMTKTSLERVNRQLQEERENTKNSIEKVMRQIQEERQESRRILERVARLEKKMI